MLSKRQIYKKEYNQSPKGIKSRRIKDWKLRGLIHTDWDNLYELYLKTDKCNKCKCEFIGTNKKCLDHDHTTGLFRNILCHRCNVNDNVKNTSGFPNVSYDKRGNSWKYQKQINGVKHIKRFKTKEEAVAYKKEYESNL